VDHDDKTICFADDNDGEAFEAKYDYDLEEQPLDVQEKLIHCGEMRQCTKEKLMAQLS
jgi:hypothetical protein